jgi:hypothetical protein
LKKGFGEGQTPPRLSVLGADGVKGQREIVKDIIELIYN